MGKSLGEINVFADSNKKTFNKAGLVNLILKNDKYTFKTKEEIDEILKKNEYTKKIDYYKKIEIRLYSKCEKVENKNYEKPCLNFIGAKDIGKYGITQVYDKTVKVHRLSYALSHNIFIEDIPKYDQNNEILDVCHGEGCDRSCIEPSHLELKTRKENMYDDKHRDETITKGVKHYNCKISEELAKQIKWSKEDGKKIKQKAKDFNVSCHIINDILNGRSWTHIPDKNGNIIDTAFDRKKQFREKRKLNINKIFTKNEYKQALKKIKDNCDIVELEESKHLESPCWLYKNCFYDYGNICFKGISFKAHILAYEAVSGKRDLSGDKKHICHKCNIRACCNPYHLYFGTPSENCIDTVKSGNNKSAKLLENNVREIRTMLNEGKISQEKIGKKFNVSGTVVSKIKNKKIWKHIR